MKLKYWFVWQWISIWELEFNTKKCVILWSNWSWKSSLVKNLYSLNKEYNITFINSQKNLTFYQWSLRWESDNRLHEKSVNFNYRTEYWDDYSNNFNVNIDKNNNFIQNDFDVVLERLVREDVNYNSRVGREGIEKKRKNKSWKGFYDLE